MKIIDLIRLSTSEHGTFGALVYNNAPFAVTLERPWKKNAPEVSSIPYGDYLCRKVSSPKFGETYEITDVPGRSHILFHRGNRVGESRGCVLVGEEFATDEQKIPLIAHSSRGFEEFLRILGSDREFSLRIHESVIK